MQNFAKAILTPPNSPTAAVLQVPSLLSCCRSFENVFEVSIFAVDPRSLYLFLLLCLHLFVVVPRICLQRQLSPFDLVHFHQENRRISSLLINSFVYITNETSRGLSTKRRYG